MPYLLHQLLSESAMRRPHQDALRLGGRALSYVELESRSNQIAHALREAGLGRGDRIGVYLGKSFESVLAVFGILKAGATYVPIDVSQPGARSARIARDCGIRALVSAAGTAHVDEFLTEGVAIDLLVDLGEQGGLPAPSQVRCTSLTDVRAMPSSIPRVAAMEDDLADILYTSGSTGQPKGVMISHRAVLTFVEWCVATFRMSPEDRVTSHAPLHFDLSTFDLFATIAAGGTVLLVPEELSVFPVQVADLLERERATMTYLVPSLLSLLAMYGQLGSHDLTALRMVLFAGEVMPIPTLRRLVEAIPHAVYYNLFGPTETNVCTYYRVTSADVRPDRTKPLPIGRPCEYSDVFLVAEDGSVVTEPGQEAEIWVRGSSLARGYWGDPERTARSFVAVPPSATIDRAYRTGDLACWDEDGDGLLFSGRRDDMIKSRGYRIELGEIEAALHAVPGVADAAAVAVPDATFGIRIHAFVVPIRGELVTRAEVEAKCGLLLPRYMRPEQIEFRTELPKTSTGKTDRQGLAGQG
jgi:amino acid adenylation domain-containing protein